MKFGIFSPGFGAFSDPRVLAQLAHTAEDSGWDGYFVWDHILFGSPVGAPMSDPWITMAAIAAATSRIRLGPLVTPLPRRHLGKLARETVTLDHLSGGRLVLGVGIGSDAFGREYSAFGQPADDRLHAEMLDEGLQVLTGLWSGQPFSFEGKHYRVDNVVFEPTPVQGPRIPIWVAATWPNNKPFRRAAQWDGVAAQSASDPLTPAHYQDILAYISEFRTANAPLDVIRTALLPTGEASEILQTIAEYEDAGVTWWLVPVEDDMGSLTELQALLRKGPPGR